MAGPFAISIFQGRKQNWRKRVGVEPTGDRIACHPPVLKTGTITGPHALPLRPRPAHAPRCRTSYIKVLQLTRDGVTFIRNA